MPSGRASHSGGAGSVLLRLLRRGAAVLLVLALLLDVVSGGAGLNLEQTAHNRVVFVLVGFVVFSLALEVLIEQIEEYYEHRHRHGMLVVIHKVKEEFLLVGVLSLVLVLLEDSLFAICFEKPMDWITPSKREACSDLYSSSAASSAANSSSSRRMLLGASSSAASSSAASSSAASSSAAGSGAAPVCDGTENSFAPFMEVAALHQLHLLIFWLAVGHVTSSFVSYFLARFTVSRWARWEEKLVEELKTSGDHLTWDPHPHAGKLSQNPVMRHMIGWRHCCCGMNDHILLSLRRYYISRHGLAPKCVLHMYWYPGPCDFEQQPCN